MAIMDNQFWCQKVSSLTSDATLSHNGIRSSAELDRIINTGGSIGVGEQVWNWNADGNNAHRVWIYLSSNQYFINTYYSIR